MSIQGAVEFALQIKRFRNIDLYDSGFYNLRASIYQQSGKKKISARPFSIAEKSLSDSKAKYTKPHIRSCIVNQSYCTKTVAISLCEEEVFLNECCYFKFDFNDIQRDENSSFILEVDLMFADYALYSELVGSDETKLSQFKKLCSYKASIRNPDEGIYEFIPILFDYRHSCALETLIHTTASNVRLKQESILSQPNQKGNDKEEQLIVQSRLLRKMLNKNSTVSMETLEEFYNSHLLPLKISYKKLVEYYATVLRIFIQESTHNEYSRFLVLNKFSVHNFNQDGVVLVDNIKQYIMQSKNEEANTAEGQSKVFGKQKSFNKAASFEEMISSLDSRNIDSIMLLITQEMTKINGRIFNMWRFLNEMILEIPKEVFWKIQKLYSKKLATTFDEKLVKKMYRTSDPVLTFEQNIGEIHTQTAAVKRESSSFKKIGSSLSVQELNSSLNTALQPVVFEEICVKEQLRSQIDNNAILAKIERCGSQAEYNGTHLIVLCHGFQGSSSDLNLLKNTISYLYPDTALLCASANEDLTDGDIASMGIRLASEVKGYIREWINETHLARLSFIGHSLGGVIIRAALPHLEDLAPKMHSLITFSSPHLGYMQNSTLFVDAGMWFLKQFKRSRSLKELTLTDASNIEDTFMFKLSKTKGLEWFKNVMLLSSFQDSYAPFESTRIQMSKKTIPDQSKQLLYEQMAANILSNITAECIYRIDVNFLIQEKNLDSMIGRAAHIQFLECKYLTKLLTHKYVDFFA